MDDEQPNRHSPQVLIGPADDDSLHVMSFNLRHIGDPPPNAWPERRTQIRAVIQRERPTVLGIQEGMFTQVQDLAEDLPAGYDWIGLGREGGSSGEYAAIYFDGDRLRPLAYDHLWLSDSPRGIGSRTWGNEVTRMLTWVRFGDRRTGTEFVHLNTHLDHAVDAARVAGAKLIRSTVDAFDVPVLVTGDFNCVAGTEPYEQLVAPDALLDTWLNAAERLTPAYSSFSGWNEPEVGEHRIDWILATPGVRTDRAAINPCLDAATRPSDHLPVQASVTLPPAPA